MRIAEWIKRALTNSCIISEVLQLKKKLYHIFILVVALLTAACAPTKLWKSEPSLNTKSNGFFDASITPIYRFDGYKGFVLNIHNKINEKIEVDWNNTFYVYSGNKDGGFWFEGIEIDAQNKSKPASIAAGGMFIKEIFPEKLRVMSQMAAARVHENMGPGENGICLTVDVPGKMISETLTFIFSEN
jgi:hypothetical protein